MRDCQIRLLPSSLGRWLASAAIGVFTTCQPCLAEVILPFGSSWEFLHPTDGMDPAGVDADFATTWHTPEEYDGPIFSDPAPAMLGYGGISGRLIATDISTPASGDRYTAYFRTTIITAQDYDWVEFEIEADDGGVLYIDGEAVASLNYTGEDKYSGLADDQTLEAAPRKVVVDGLSTGEHVVAFSLHNGSPISSDIGFTGFCASG